MRQAESGEELEQRILQDAARFQEPESLSPALEVEFLKARDLDDPHLARARAVVGMGMEAMNEIDLNRTGEETDRLNSFARLKNTETAALAGITPERLERTDDPAQKWLALMEILSGVDVESADLDWLQRLGVTVAPWFERKPKAIQKLILRRVSSMVRHEAENFVRVFPNPEAEGMIAALESDTLHTGVGYEANLVTESARSEAEARRNIDWNKAAIKRIAAGPITSYEAYTGIAIKPTSIVAFSDSAIGRPSRKKDLKEALCEIFAVADRFRLKDGKSVIITIDSERSDIVDMVGEAILEARREFPKIRVGTAVQDYHRSTEELLVRPFLEEKIDLNAGEEPLGMRLVNGANIEGEMAHHSAMGWFRGIPIAPGRHATHANRMRFGSLIMDPLKEGRLNVTFASMNVMTLMDELIALSHAGVLASQNHGYISLALLNNMTGPETFRYLRKYQAVIGARKVPHFHQYVPVIDVERIVELFKYYLRRIEELVGGSPDGEIANFLGELAKHGPKSPEFRKTQIRNGVIAAMRYHKNESANHPLDQINPNYRGRHEPLIIPRSALAEFQAQKDAGIEVIGISLHDFKIIPAVAPGAPEDSALIDKCIRECEERESEKAPCVGLQFPKSAQDTETRKILESKGPTRPELVLGRYELATSKDIDTAFDIAKNAKWSQRSHESRIATVINAVMKLREKRDTLCKSLMLNTGKPYTEADAEICEAMDFFNLSALQMQEWLQRDNLEFEPGGDGVEVVIGPKNFPIAIPAYQIIAALLNGERVIFKPSGGEGEESFEAGYELCKCLWDGGVPKDALVFLPCDNEKAAELSSKAQKLKLTGSAEVAEKIWENNEDVDLSAETGGPNVCVIDSTADLKATATEIILSICQFGGQKCSKPVMIILTEDVNLEEFKTHLLSQMLAMLQANALKRNVDNSGLTKSYDGTEKLAIKAENCLPGEKWLSGEIPVVQQDKSIKMEKVSAKPAKMGDIGLRFIADPENFDWSLLDEIFAPIATITQIKGRIPEAIKIIGGLKGALTGALFSQNREAIKYARKHWKTGNLYFGRKCTAARGDQGFGDGEGAAHYGAHGIKTGTPEYLIMSRGVRRKKGKYAKYDKDLIPDWKPGNDETGVAKAAENLHRKLLHDSKSFTPQMKEELTAAVNAGYSYLYEHANYYSQNRPTPYQIRGQYDWIESHKIATVVYRVSPGDSMEDILCKIFSTLASRNTLHLSLPPSMTSIIEIISNLLGESIEKLFPNLNLRFENDQAFAESIEHGKPACILYSDRKKVPAAVWTAARKSKIYIDRRKTTGDGRVDMITQYRQRSYCWVYHVAGDVSYEEAIRRNHGLDPEWGVPYKKIDPKIEDIQKAAA